MLSQTAINLRMGAKERNQLEDWVCFYPNPFNLETAVEREKAVQEIYVHREFLKLVVTLWVIRDFKSFLAFL
jgi:hypothetical protein